MTDPYDHDAPTETMWEGRFITARKRGRWEYVSRSRNIGAAVILAIEESAAGERYVILVEQYRVPLGRPCLELPAGLVGDDGSPADPAETAMRELEEETGYRAAQMTHLGHFFSSPGMVSEGFDLFRASGLERVSEGGGLSDEDIIVHRVALDALQEFIAAKRAEGCAMDVRLLLLLGGGMIG